MHASSMRGCQEASNLQRKMAALPTEAESLDTGGLMRSLNGVIGGSAR